MVRADYPLAVLTGWLDAFAVAFGVVFLAELGDKTQLMVLAFSSRYHALPVVLGVVTATALMMAASVVLGAALGAIVPGQLVLLLGGVAFLLFAIWTLIRVDDADEHAAAPVAGKTGSSVARSALVVGTALAVAELGDKSMLATLTLAAQAQPVATWAGATLAMTCLSLAVIVIGRQIGTRLPHRLIRLVAAAAFAIFGVLLLLEALS